jgi:ribosome-binding protein aMBF1 (putative translation factor)
MTLDPKILSWADLKAELKDVAAGRKSAPADAAQPSYSSSEAAQLHSRAEEQGDVIAFDNATQAAEEAFPLDFVRRLSEGKESRVKLYREYRGLTQAKLAADVGCDVSAIAEIEALHAPESTELLKKIAAAVSIDLDDLIETPE